MPVSFHSHYEPATRVPSPVALPPPVFEEPFVQRGRKTLVVLVWITAILGGVAAVFGAWLMSNGPGATIAVFYSIIPLPVILFIYWWVDRVEPEPFRYKVAAFVWGAVVAVVLALIFEGLLAMTGVSENVQIALGAPVIEEATKGLFMLVIMLRMRRVIHSVVDGIIYAGLVATGFAAVENIVYYAASYLGFDEAIPIKGIEAATATFIVRGLFSPFAHPLFTTSLGIAIGLAVFRKTRTAKVMLVFVGYLGSVALHALWNGSIVVTGPAGFLVVYLILALMLVGLFIAIIFMRIKEQDKIANALRYIAARGWLHPAEVPYLVQFPRRRQVRNYAARFGPYALAAMKDYQKSANEAAYLYHLVATDHANRFTEEHTYRLLEHMWELRPWLRFPQALPPQQW